MRAAELVRRVRQTGGRGRKLRGLIEILSPYRWRVLAMFLSLLIATGAALAPAPLAKLAIDDGIHHGAGMAYERVLLEGAGRSVQTNLIEAANRMLPLFAQHALWRPKAREFIGALMRETDIRMLKEDLENGIRLAKSLGIDPSGIELPHELH